MKRSNIASIHILILTLSLSCLVLPSTAQEQPPVITPDYSTPDEDMEDFEEPQPPPPCDRESPHTKRWLKRIKKQNPEEYARLSELKETDPMAFHQALADKLLKSRMKRSFKSHPRLKEFYDSLSPEEQQALAQTLFRNETPSGRQERHRRGRPGPDTEEDRPSPVPPKTRELAQKYRAATSEQDRAVLKADIIKQLEQEFDKRTRKRKRSVEQLEKKLSRFRERLAKREANRDTIIQHRFEELTCDDALKW